MVWKSLIFPGFPWQFIWKLHDIFNRQNKVSLQKQCKISENNRTYPPWLGKFWNVMCQKAWKCHFKRVDWSTTKSVAIIKYHKIPEHTMRKFQKNFLKIPWFFQVFQVFPDTYQNSMIFPGFPGFPERWEPYQYRRRTKLPG